ncbi:MAG: hypothetical protein ACYTGA_12550 [Planctomycetota bacterium]|jgi:hypothetical protein
MEDTNTQSPGEDLSPEVLKRALKAFKKRLKLTALDEDSRLGRGAFSGGAQGICAVQPPNQYPPEVWEELCRQGKLRHSVGGIVPAGKTPSQRTRVV